MANQTFRYSILFLSWENMNFAAVDTGVHVIIIIITRVSQQSNLRAVGESWVRPSYDNGLAGITRKCCC